MEISAYNIKYLDQILELWNNIIEEGIYFPQIEKLTKENADSYFKSQDFTGIAVEDGEVYGVHQVGIQLRDDGIAACHGAHHVQSER